MCFVLEGTVFCHCLPGCCIELSFTLAGRVQGVRGGRGAAGEVVECAKGGRGGLGAFADEFREGAQERAHERLEPVVTAEFRSQPDGIQGDKA